MEASILIVSRNRKKELQKTSSILRSLVDLEKHEIRVFLDGETENINEVKQTFSEVIWSGSERSLGASKARSILYSKAKGTYLFGFDDDAHPIDSDFIKKSQEIFRDGPKIGIIAFREIKGKFENKKVLNLNTDEVSDYLTNDFMGCGFAIRKEVYDRTRGFPEWIDIYGEESCLAMETLSLGYDILFTYQIAVHHRVNKIDRQNTGANYFRFEKQLKNTSFFYLVYYPFPLVLRKLVKLHYHNFRKYAMTDKQFFQAYWSALWQVLKFFPEAIQYRKPVSLELLQKIRSLRNPEYHSNISGK